MAHLLCARGCGGYATPEEDDVYCRSWEGYGHGVLWKSDEDGACKGAGRGAGKFLPTGNVVLFLGVKLLFPSQSSGFMR